MGSLEPECLCPEKHAKMLRIDAGLKVNFSKSKLIGVNVERIELMHYEALLNCKIIEVPFTYLGLPVGANPKKVSTWEPAVSKLRKMLSVWKHKSLYFGGGICLIKSVLSAIPLFYFSFFKAFKSVLLQCKRIQRDFSWGVGVKARKLAWVRWEVVCKVKEDGDLGIRDLEMFNKALLAKWRWRILQDRHSLWVRVLNAMYGVLIEITRTEE